MKQPPHTKQNFSSPNNNKTKIIVVSVLLGIGVLVLLALLGFLFLQGGFQFLTPATQAFPTLFVPTPDCGSPTLVVGTTTFQIQNLTRAADGSLTVPADTSGIAYWVEGTDHNYVFVVSPTPDNVSIMSTITAGTIVKVTWKNCNSTTYTLSASQPGSFNASAPPDQSIDAITVFFPSDASGAGFVFKGDLTEQQFSTIDTPNPSEMQAEIGLLETTSSSDGKTIRIGVSIHNNGQVAITISPGDVSLVQADSTPLVMVSSEPALPKEIAIGATEKIYLTFPRPSSGTATLKILTVEYDIEGY